MEKSIPIGSVAAFKISFVGGKALFDVGVGVAGVDLYLSVDSGSLIDLMFAAIEKASPSGAVAIEESVKIVIKDAVAAIQ